MHNFEDIVKRCYQKNSDEEISNGSIEHAKILADYLFRYAKEKNKDITLSSLLIILMVPLADFLIS
jgi:hypothetical protein